MDSTSCCIVGGGPAGAMLALLLARQGISVILLEAHQDFERAFRGDTLHASVMEILDDLGLADALLQLRHAKVRQVAVPTRDGPFMLNLFGALKTKFPYITVIAQSRFLEFITTEAQRSPHFQIVMGARAEGLIEDAGTVRGVRYQKDGVTHELRTALVVGADGRFSRVRKLAGFEPIATSSPIDVLWFRLSRRADDLAEALSAWVGSGYFVILIDRFEYWQVGCVVVKGGYQAIRAAGIEALRAALGSVAPEWADRFAELRDWNQISVLSVESSRLRRWYQPGLLLIGDAAHVMSPVGGVGINYAIQDAVVTANLLGPKLRAGTPIHELDLAAVQRERELPIRIIQTFQSLAQDRVAAGVLTAAPGRLVLAPRFLLRLINRAWLLAIPARFIAYGFRPPHVQHQSA